ncbi:MAG: hypothetical protein ACKN9T_14095, partial [Candidatus Methylumidiphilus sp.]
MKSRAGIDNGDAKAALGYLLQYSPPFVKGGWAGLTPICANLRYNPLNDDGADQQAKKSKPRKARNTRKENR